MHRITARKMRRCGVWAPRVQSLVQALPFPDGTFNSIVSTFPAEFIIQPPAWEEFSRVLTPGGRLIVTGTCLRADNRFLQQVFRIVFGTLEQGQRSWHERISTAVRLKVTETGHGEQPVRMPVVIAEKLP
jgi:ubiquinone/menaquinone biosynthesis C-methylase UbiE